MEDSTAIADYPFLTGGGEMGALTRTFDWSKTAVGSPDDWPPSLRTTVSILLTSRFPMLLFWGPERIQFYNDAFRPSLGNNGKHPTALGQRAEACWPETWSGTGKRIDDIMNGGAPTWSEDQLIPIYRNGRIEDVYWTFSYSPIRDESGHVAGALVVVNETTEKVLTLRKAEESEQQLRFAIDAAELGTWDMDPITNRFTANDRLKSWFGLPADAEISLALALSVIADNDRQRVATAIQSTLQARSGGQYDISYTIINSQTGTERMVRAKGRAFFDQAGVAYRFNGTLQDITGEVTAQKQLVRTNEELTSSIRNFAFVTDFMPQIVWATQPDGTHDFYNQRWYDFTGLTPGQSMGEGWAQVLHPDDAGRTAEVWQTSLRTGQPYDIEYRMCRHDGQYRWLLARALPMRDADGQIVRWFGTCTDIHDQKTASAELEQRVAERTRELEVANFDLQRSNQNLERFAYVASHDLQEPLRKIQSFGDILQSTYGAQLGAGTDLLTRMQQAAGRMSMLIKDLLAFSRIRTQRDTFAPVALNAVVSGVLTDLELAVQESGAVVEVAKLPTVPGDEPQLRQLFQNLLSNALKFRRTDQPPRITIDCRIVEAADLPTNIKPTRPTERYYEITVTDNGIGFDEKYTDRIFEVFQRLHGKSQYSGTGIGLAIVQKVADNHGGAITAKSRPGEGAQFVLDLPI